MRRIAEVEIPSNTGDFRLMSRRVVDNVVSLEESHGFLRGLVGLVGFKQTAVQYERDARAAGSSKYNQIFGSLRIGLNGIVGFSRYPLHVISIGGILFSIIVGSRRADLLRAYAWPGLAFPSGGTIAILVSFLAGIQLLSLGVMGEYVGRIYDEVRHRPKYIVESTVGLDTEANERISGPTKAATVIPAPSTRRSVNRSAPVSPDASSSRSTAGLSHRALSVRPESQATRRHRPLEVVEQRVERSGVEGRALVRATSSSRAAPASSGSAWQHRIGETGRKCSGGDRDQYGPSGILAGARPRSDASARPWTSCSPTRSAAGSGRRRRRPRIRPADRRRSGPAPQRR